MSVKSLFVAWSEDGRFHNPLSLNGALGGLAYRCQFSSCCRCDCPATTATQTSVVLLSLKHLKNLIVPTVFASSDSDENSKGCSTNSKQQLEPRKPEVIITDDDIAAFLKNESGYNRLRSMFTLTHGNELTPDLDFIVQSTVNCSFMFFLLTSVFGSKVARERYLEKNKSTKFDTKFMAFRSYNDAIIFGGLRVGLTWAIKAGFFAGTFMLVSQSVAVYRNKTSVVEYILAGGLTCAMLRADVGLRGMFAGGVIGSALGLVGGACICILLHGMGVTQQQRHRHQISELLLQKKEVELLSHKSHIISTQECDGTVTGTVSVAATS